MLASKAKNTETDPANPAEYAAQGAEASWHPHAVFNIFSFKVIVLCRFSAFHLAASARLGILAAPHYQQELCQSVQQDSAVCRNCAKCVPDLCHEWTPLPPSAPEPEVFRHHSDKMHPMQLLRLRVESFQA